MTLHLRFLIIFLLFNVSFFAFAAEPTVSSANLERQIVSVSSQLSNLKSEAQVQNFKQQVNALLAESVKCEKAASAELTQIESIQSGANQDKESTSDGLVNAKVTELKQLKTRCQYHQLELQKIKQQLLAKQAQLQTDYYTQKSAIYFKDAEIETSKQQPSKILDNQAPFILAILILIAYFSLVQSANSTLKVDSIKNAHLFFGQLILHLVGTLVFILVGKLWQEWQLDGLLIASLSLSYFILNTRLNSKMSIVLNYLIVGVILVALPTFLLKPDAILHPILHAGLLLSLTVAAYHTCRQINQSYFFKLGLAALAVILLIEVMEYHYLAHQLLLALLIVLFGIQACRFIVAFTHNTLALLQDEQLKWTAPIAQFIDNIQQLNTFPLKLLINALNITLSIAFLFMLLDYTGLPVTIKDQIETAYIDGIKLGTMMLHPRDILIGLISLAIILIIALAIRYRIENKPAHTEVVGTPNSDQEANNEQMVSDGSQQDSAAPPTLLAPDPSQKGSEAVGALFWYSAVITAILVSLSIAGFSVQNLAIVAGAFSIGIGFGLQNIVSNFISGLILLIERPIKPGDWVAVGNTEGFVQKISIRATQLRTFDKADILIPNSELISQQVTNMMLSDRVGRIRLPIGVAYGSDTALVKQVLETIVLEHPLVIKDNPDYKPMIVFMGFGDSSLNFEVRCFLHNIADVNRARSEINFEIDAQFRKHNIAIPFPQRDIHIIKPKGEPDEEL